MTRQTVFVTPGQLDLSCLTTFGVSVKTNDNPIGRFGTGLKYALAVLARNGAEVYISTNGTVYRLHTQAKIIRDKQFDTMFLAANQVQGAHIGKIYLPFTTDLGKDWELWQAFRELYSNTLDENGKLATELQPAIVPKGYTYISVFHDEFAEIAENKEQYFKEDKTNAIQAGALGHIHPGETAHGLFYKGIRVAELNKPTVHTYDVSKRGHHLELTEDRTVKYSWEVESNIVALIRECTDVEVIRKAITAPYTSFEYDLDFNDACYAAGEPSEAFFKAVELECNSKAVNKSAVKLWEEKQPLRNRFTCDSELDQFELIRIKNILDVIATGMHLPGAVLYEVIPAATLPTGTKCLQDVEEGVIIVDSKLIRQDPLGYELAKVLAESIFQMEKVNPVESLLEVCGFQKGKQQQPEIDEDYVPF
jgi:hypothetical protein